MAYSTIQRKPCKHYGCGNAPKLGCGGYCFYHREEDVAFKRKDDKARTKQSLRSLNEVQKEVGVPKGTAELQRWFEDRHREMKGYCQHCNGRTEQGKSTYKCSIGHILPKAYFKSIATHPDNWIELCFYGKSCHTNFDNHMIDLIDLNCFDEVVKKFVSMYPSIAENEKRRIPQLLLNYLDVEK